MEHGKNLSQCHLHCSVIEPEYPDDRQGTNQRHVPRCEVTFML